MHIIKVDTTAIEALGPTERYVQNLVGRASGSTPVSVSWIVTPVGDGSPEGLHTHTFDQSYLLLEGDMTVELDGEVAMIGPGTLVRFPAGHAHRNQNTGTVPTVHLAINAPAPELGVPFATRVPES